MGWPRDTTVFPEPTSWNGDDNSPPSIEDEGGDPEPCTDAARAAGCICIFGWAGDDTPEPIIDRWCPLHGSDDDPDHAWEAARDDADWFTPIEDD